MFSKTNKILFKNQNVLFKNQKSFDHLLIIYMKKNFSMLIDEKIARWLSRRDARVSRALDLKTKDLIGHL